MLAILEVPAIRRLATPLSVREFHLLNEQESDGQRTELLRGVIIQRMVPSPLYVSLVRRLHQMVESAAAPGTLACKEDPLTLHDSEVVPDISVVLGTMRDYLKVHPDTALLTMEVAVSTEDLDREKAFIYAEANMSEYWLILPERGLIEWHTEPRDGLYTRRQLFRVGEVVQSVVLPGLRVDLGEFFAGTR